MNDGNEETVFQNDFGISFTYGIDKVLVRNNVGIVFVIGSGDFNIELRFFPSVPVPL